MVWRDDQSAGDCSLNNPTHAFSYGSFCFLGIQAFQRTKKQRHGLNGQRRIATFLFFLFLDLRRRFLEFWWMGSWRFNPLVFSLILSFFLSTLIERQRWPAREATHHGFTRQQTHNVPWRHWVHRNKQSDCRKNKNCWSARLHTNTPKPSWFSLFPLPWHPKESSYEHSSSQ